MPQRSRSSADASDAFKVAIRVRPLIARERKSGAQMYWSCDTKQIFQLGPDGKQVGAPHFFDRVFDHEETTQDVYDEIAQPILESVMEGYNGTIFAYGQTSSGKTYTMMGDGKTEGIIPYAIDDIFHSIDQHPGREYLIRVSFMEIYNETIADLLAAKDSKAVLQIREDTEGSVYVQNLEEKLVRSKDEVLDWMKKGEKRRHVAGTNMNERSSRSHTIFRVIIESREQGAQDDAVNVSQLNLVDLAGSERVSQTGAEGQRLKESGAINQSLLTLSNVIRKLSECPPEGAYIAYRDSKLTRILQMSLGGNSKTAVICAVTPAEEEQTKSTLQFATTSKSIKNKPVVNEVLSEMAMLNRAKKEIAKLQKRINEMNSQTGFLTLEKDNEELRQRLQYHEQQQQEQEKKLKNLELFMCRSSLDAKDVSEKAKKNPRRATWCPRVGQKPRLSFDPSSFKPPAQNLSLHDVPELSIPRKRRKHFSGEPLFDLDPIVEASPGESFSLEGSSGDSLPDFDMLEESRASTGSSRSSRSSRRVAFLPTVDELPTLMFIEQGTQTEAEEGPTTTEDVMLPGATNTVPEKEGHLEQELQFKNDQCVMLQCQLSSVKERLEAVEAQKDKIIQELEAKVATHQEVVQQLNEVIEETVEDKQAKEEEVTNLRAKVSRLELRLNTGSNSSDEIERLSHTVTSLEHQLATAQSDRETEVGALQFNISSLGKQLEDLRQRDSVEIRQLQDQISNLEGALAATKQEDDANDEAFSVGQMAAAEELLQKNQQIVALQQQLSELEKRRRAYSTSDAEVIELRKTLDDALQHCEVIVAEKSNLETALQELQDNNIKLSEDFQHIVVQKDQLQDQLKMREEEFSELEEFTRLEREMHDEERRAHEADIAEKKPSEDEVEGLRKTAADAEAVTMETSRRLAEVSAEKEELVSRLAGLEKQVEVLDREKADAESYLHLEKDQHQRLVADLRQQLQQSYDESAQLRLLLDGDTTVDLSAQQQSTDKINALQEKLQELQLALQDMTAERDQVRLDLGESVEQVVDSQEELYKLKQAYGDLQAKYETITQEIQGQQAEGESATANEKEEVIRLREDLATSQGTVDRLIEQLTALEQKQAEHSLQESALKEELAAKQARVDEATEQLNTLEQKSAEDLKQLSTLKEQLGKTESNLAEARKCVQDLPETSVDRDTQSRPPGDVMVLQEQLHRARMAHAELQKQYEKLENELSSARDFQLAEENKDMHQQQKISQLELARRESMAISSKNMEDNRKEIDSLNKQVSDLQAKLQHQTLTCQQAVHEREKATAKLEDYKVQVRDLENLHASHATNTNRHQNMDPDKMLKTIKQLEWNLDLTKQKLQKLEKENKKLQELEDKCDRLQFAKSQLQGEVERSKMALETEKEQNSIQLRRNNNSTAEMTEMRRQVEKFAEEAKTASGRLAAKELEVRTLQQELQTARDKQQQDCSSSQDQHRLITELQHKLQCAQREVEETKGQLNVAEENHQSGQERLTVTEQRLEQTCRDLQDAGLQVEKLRKECSELRDRCSELEEVGKSAATAADQRVTNLQDRLTSLETERDTLMADLRTLSGEKGQVKKDMEKLQEEHHSQLTSLCDQLTAVEQEKETLRQQLSRQGETGEALAQLQAKLDQVQDNFKLETAKVGGLHVELSKTKAALSEMEGQVPALQANLADKESQVSAAEGTAQQLHTQLLQVRTDSATLQTQLEESRNHCKELGVMLSKTQTELKNLQLETATVGNLQDELSDTRAAVAEMDGQVLELQANLADKESQVSAAEGTAQQLHTQLLQVRTDSATLQTQLEEARSQSEELAAQLTETQAHLKQLQDTYNNSRLEVNDLQDVTNDFKEENAALASQVSQLDTNLELTREQNNKLEEQARTLLEEKEEVEKQLHDLEDLHWREVRRLETCCEEADDELDEAKKELKKLKEAVSHGADQTELETLRTRLTTLQQEGQEEKKKLEEQAKTLLEQKEKAENQLHKFEDLHWREVRRLETCCEEADDELDQAKKELQKYKEAVSQGADQTELETLRTRLTTLQQEGQEEKNKLEEQAKTLLEEKQNVEKELNELQDLHWREVRRLETCCDEADDELDEAKKELKKLKETMAHPTSSQDTQGLKARFSALQQAAMQEKATLQNENKALQSELATLKMQVAGLQHDIQISADPYKKRCRILNEDNLKLRQDVRDRENEIRRLRQNMDESFHQPKEPTIYSSGSGIVNSTNVYILEAEKSKLSGKVKQLTAQVQKLTDALDKSKSEGTDIRQQLDQTSAEKTRLEEYISLLRRRHGSAQGQREQPNTLPGPVARTLLEDVHSSPGKPASPSVPLSPRVGVVSSPRVGTVSQASGAAGIAQRVQAHNDWMEMFDYGDDGKDLNKDDPNCKVS